MKILLKVVPAVFLLLDAWVFIPTIRNSTRTHSLTNSLTHSFTHSKVRYWPSVKLTTLQEAIRILDADEARTFDGEAKRQFDLFGQVQAMKLQDYIYKVSACMCSACMCSAYDCICMKHEADTRHTHRTPRITHSSGALEDWGGARCRKG